MVVYISFKINREHIAKTLCVKKEIQNNTCQGKCHLKKQLKKADNEERKQVPKSQKDKHEVLYSYFTKQNDYLINSEVFVSKLNFGFGKDFRTKSFTSEIYRPPEFHLI